MISPTAKSLGAKEKRNAWKVAPVRKTTEIKRVWYDLLARTKEERSLLFIAGNQKITLAKPKMNYIQKALHIRVILLWEIILPH